MESILISVATVVLLLPWIVYGWLYGWAKVKRLKEKEWPAQTKPQVVEPVTPEDRMDQELKINTDPLEYAARWTNSPSPQEEIAAMNERVYEEGIVHPLPQTEIEEPNTRPNV